MLVLQTCLPRPGLLTLGRRNNRSALNDLGDLGGTMRSHDGSSFSMSASTSGVWIVR
jgi:hypothetical protein